MIVAAICQNDEDIPALDFLSGQFRRKRAVS